MKKRFFYFMLVIILAISAFTMVGCKDKAKSSETYLALNKKYYAYEYLNKERYEMYFTFYNNGTCELYYYFNSANSSGSTEYTATYSYYIQEDTVFCYFKEYKTGENNGSNPSYYMIEDNYIFGCTLNVIMNVKTGETYINEDWAENAKHNSNSSYSSYSSPRS